MAEMGSRFPYWGKKENEEEKDELSNIDLSFLDQPWREEQNLPSESELSSELEEKQASVENKPIQTPTQLSDEKIIKKLQKEQPKARVEPEKEEFDKNKAIVELLKKQEELASRQNEEAEKEAEFQKTRNLIAALGSAGAKIGAGIAGLGAKSNVQADTSGFDKLRKMWLEQQKASQKRKEAQQDALNERLDIISKIKTPADMTEYQRRYLDYLESSLKNKEDKNRIWDQKNQLRAVNQQFKYENDIEKDRQKIQQEKASNKEWQTAKSMINEAKTAETFLDAAIRGDATAYASLNTRLAKAMGEKGALSEADVTRYGLPTSYIGKGAAWLKRLWSNQPTAEVSDSIRKVLQALQDRGQSIKQEINDQYAKKYMKRMNKPGQEQMTYDEARWVVDENAPMPQNLAERYQDRDASHKRLLNNFLKVTNMVRGEPESLPPKDEIQPQSTPPQAFEGKVRVKHPNGQTGFIPRENLEKALEAGYVEIK